MPQELSIARKKIKTYLKKESFNVYSIKVYWMRRLFVFCILNLGVLTSSFSQSKPDFLGVWEIYKVDVGDAYVDQKEERVSETYRNKLKGQKDSALTINLFMGTLKNLMGMEYHFKENEEMSQYNPNNRKTRNGKYSYANHIIKASITHTVEEYKIVFLDKTSMVLEIKLSDTTKAQVYLKHRS